MSHVSASIAVLPAAPARARRTNLFLMATVMIDGATHPVRVRNLSASGAMIESPSLPAVGTVLALRRGSLAVEAQLIWIAGDRGGVRFATAINPSRWIPRASAQGQDQVDRVIAESRAELANWRPAATAPVARDHARLLDRIAEELALVARRLEVLGSDLASEPPIVIRHSARLQEIDLSVQTLAHVGRLLTTDNPLAALKAIGMADLRRRLERASPL